MRLLTLSPERMRAECERAAWAEATDRAWRRRRRRVGLICLAEFAIGLWLVGQSWHVVGEDAGVALRGAGIIVGWVVPYCTLIAMWLREDS